MRENGEKESPKFNQLMEDENVHDSEENKYNNLSFKEISSKDSLSSSNYSFSKTIIYDKYEEENDSSNHISKRNNFGQKLENFNNSKNESKNIVFTNNILKISKHQNSIIKNKNNSGLKKALNKTISPLSVLYILYSIDSDETFLILRSFYISYAYLPSTGNYYWWFK